MKRLCNSVFRCILPVYLCLYLLFIGNKTTAQVNSNSSKIVGTDKYADMDISDIINKITKKSFRIPDDTIFLKSKGPFVTPLLIPGYAMVTGFLGEVTCNISFYTLRNDSAKISSISTCLLYTSPSP